MFCNNCGKELDFDEMRSLNLKKTGEPNLVVYLVIERWKIKNTIGIPYDIYEFSLRAIRTDLKRAERDKDILDANYEDTYPKDERPIVFVEKTRFNHLYGYCMMKRDRAGARYQKC